MLRFLLFLLIPVITIYYFLAGPKPVHLLPGVLVTTAPVIGALDRTLQPWQKNGYTITPLATYSLRARVLSKEHYFAGRETDLSAYDLALGWQNMSDSAVLDKLDIEQGNRWYTYEWQGAPPMPPAEIPLEAGNMHIIAGTPEVANILPHIAVGNVIALAGYLIRADAPDGWHWASATGTYSEGPHACKVIWVTGLVIEQ